MVLSSSACGDSARDDDARDGGRRMDSQVPDPTEPDAYIVDTGSDEPDPDAEPPIPEGCGDGMRAKDSEEQCDDGANKSGDGCSAQCRLETGYACDPNGGACMPVCGDGALVGVEMCDDMNAMAGDGCDEACKVERGWACPEAGKACVPARCGDMLEVGGEQCDYGDDENGDGCSDTCKVEPGWACGAGACTAKACGDGIRAGAELCDDMNMSAMDGCSGDCAAVEPFHLCPMSGGMCSKVTRCGDGIFTADEKCDDGNIEPGDGCSALCTVEDGFLCPGGTSCANTCGDSKVRGLETCDDGDDPTSPGAGGDGCSAKCQIEPGFKCPAAGGACSAAVCGNALTEGLEECDDTAAGQLDVPYDGCYECKVEPTCNGGACTAKCGDGIKFPNEVCDDGNNRSGDGCNATCTALEPGFSCQVREPTPPATISLPVIYRDFQAHGLPDGHPDFNDGIGDDNTELVWDRLGVDANNDSVPDNAVAAGSVVYKPTANTTTTHGAANFNQWYHDSALGKRVILPMTFTGANGTYTFADRTFYPLDGKGWQDTSVPVGAREADLGPDKSTQSDGCGGGVPGDVDADKTHNFGFTSEVRFWFTYKGGEKLTFTGDDDVWVFIAGKRVIDLGGVHCAQSAAMTLIGGNAAVDNDNNGSDDATVTLGLQVGFVYEAVVFQAERHVTESSYRLGLGQFFTPRTECVAVCGDGIRTAGELCDSGGVCMGGAKDAQACSIAQPDACGAGIPCNSLNDGGYGHCGPACNSRGSFCGDDVKDAAEACDDGSTDLDNDGKINNGAYNGCNPDCTLGPRCGDGTRTGTEKCDQGAMNMDSTYGKCSTSCEWGPRCGDGTLQADQGEQCDDKVNKASYGAGGCAPSCKFAPSCGDGVLQASQGETCDDGKAMNTGMYGGCNANCSRAAHCGDKKRDAENGEECDDGNANNFDGCSMQCKTELILQ
jgi:fibro-slime domain-containing protein